MLSWEVLLLVLMQSMQLQWDGGMALLVELVLQQQGLELPPRSAWQVEPGSQHSTQVCVLLADGSL